MKPYPFLCAMLGLFATAGRLQALDSVLIPTEDAFVSKNNPTFNYGAGGSLDVAADTNTNAPYSTDNPHNPQGLFDTLLKFNLSATKANFNAAFGVNNWAIQSVTLKLTNFSGGATLFNPATAGNYQVQWMQNDTWVEGTGKPDTQVSDGVTYNTLSQFTSVLTDLGTFSSTPSTTPSLNLESSFVNDIKNGLDVSLLLTPADGDISFQFNSRSFATQASRPQFTVTAQMLPEPSSLALLGLTAAAWLGARRRCPV